MIDVTATPRTAPIYDERDLVFLTRADYDELVAIVEQARSVIAGALGPMDPALMGERFASVGLALDRRVDVDRREG